MQSARCKQPIILPPAGPPPSVERESIYKWWRADNLPATKDGPRLMGKPSVVFRKTVNTTTADGRTVAVNAQQYAVLVMDVPDLMKLRAKWVWLQ